MKKNNRGVREQVSGSLKEAVGKITGDAKVEAEGVAEKSAGGAGQGIRREKGIVLGVGKK